MNKKLFTSLFILFFLLVNALANAFCEDVFANNNRLIQWLYLDLDVLDDETLTEWIMHGDGLETSIQYSPKIDPLKKQAILTALTRKNIDINSLRQDAQTSFPHWKRQKEETHSKKKTNKRQTEDVLKFKPEIVHEEVEVDTKYISPEFKLGKNTVQYQQISQFESPKNNLIIITNKDGVDSTNLLPNYSSIRFNWHFGNKLFNIGNTKKIADARILSFEDEVFLITLRSGYENYYFEIRENHNLTPFASYRTPIDRRKRETFPYIESIKILKEKGVIIWDTPSNKIIHFFDLKTKKIISSQTFSKSQFMVSQVFILPNQELAIAVVEIPKEKNRAIFYLYYPHQEKMQLVKEVKGNFEADEFIKALPQQEENSLTYLLLYFKGEEDEDSLLRGISFDAFNEKTSVQEVTINVKNLRKKFQKELVDIVSVHLSNHNYLMLLARDAGLILFDPASDWIVGYFEFNFSGSYYFGMELNKENDQTFAKLLFHEIQDIHQQKSSIEVRILLGK